MKMTSIQLGSEPLFFIDFVPPVGARIKNGNEGKMYRVIDILIWVDSDALGAPVTIVTALVEEI